MSEFDLNAIEARADAATPGPWLVEIDEPTLSRMVRSEDHTLDIDFGYVGNRTQEDAAFVAAARTDIPALIAEAKRLDGVVQLLGTHLQGGAEDYKDLASAVAHVTELASEMKASADRILSREPVENGICAGERYEAEVELALAERVLAVLHRVGGAS